MILINIHRYTSCLNHLKKTILLTPEVFWYLEHNKIYSGLCKKRVLFLWQMMAFLSHTLNFIPILNVKSLDLETCLENAQTFYSNFGQKSEIKFFLNFLNLTINQVRFLTQGNYFLPSISYSVHSDILCFEHLSFT